MKNYIILLVVYVILQVRASAINETSDEKIMRNLDDLEKLDDELIFKSRAAVPVPCNSVVEMKPGQKNRFTSPNHPMSYTTNDHCNWIFKAAPGETLKMFCIIHKMPKYKNPWLCTPDYIDINGKKYCGHRRPDGTYKNYGDQVEVNFYSGDIKTNSKNGEKMGFICKVKTIGEVKLLPDCKCGVKNGHPLSRVAGGKEEIKFKYPWIAAMFYMGKVFGSATLIGDTFAITSKAAFHGIINYDDVNIHIGAHKISKEPLDTVGIFKVSFDPNGLMAIIELNDAVKFRKDNKVAPACLPMEDHMIHKGVIVGWGITEDGGMNSEKPIEVKLSVVEPDDLCKELKELNDIDPSPDIFCTGYEPFQKVGPCKNDEGAALVENGFPVGILVGSGKEKCGDIFKPFFFVKVQSLKGWIDEITKGSLRTCLPPQLMKMP